MAYKQFELTIYTLAPMHIGSGYTYTNKEYIYENGDYYFPDMTILYSRLRALGLAEQFERFLLEENHKGKKRRLQDFFKDKRIANRDFGGYKLAGTLTINSKKDGELNNISQFCRDAFGQPYVPGSSVKGAIRTILMNTRWKKEVFLGEKSVRGRKITYENKDVIPWGAKHNKPFDDLFNEIRVSDSQPLTLSQLILAQKWDASLKNQRPKDLPVFRECLKPMTPLKVTITTTTDRAATLMENLQNYAKEYYRDYEEFFLKDLKQTYRQDNIQYPLYLGGGSGVWTKTKINEARFVVPKLNGSKKTRMVGKGVFKLTKAAITSIKTQKRERSLINNRDNVYEMGKCCFTLKEVR